MHASTDRQLLLLTTTYKAGTNEINWNQSEDFVGVRKDSDYQARFHERVLKYNDQIIFGWGHPLISFAPAYMEQHKQMISHVKT